jgi:hypothetical protein
MPAWALAKEREEQVEAEREREREERWLKWQEERWRVDRESRTEATSSARGWLESALAEAEDEDDWMPTPDKERTSSSCYVPLSERSRGVASRLPRISRAGFGASGARSMAPAALASGYDVEGPTAAPELPRPRRAGARPSWSRAKQWSFSRNPSWARPSGADSASGEAPAMEEPLPPPPPPPRRRRGEQPGQLIAKATAHLLTPTAPAADKASPSSLRDMEVFTEGAVKRSQKMFDDMMLPMPGLPPPPPPRKKRMETQLWL